MLDGLFGRVHRHRMWIFDTATAPTGTDSGVQRAGGTDDDGSGKFAGPRSGSCRDSRHNGRDDARGWPQFDRSDDHSRPSADGDRRTC